MTLRIIFNDPPESYTSYSLAWNGWGYDNARTTSDAFEFPKIKKVLIHEPDTRMYLIVSENIFISFRLKSWCHIDHIIRSWELGEFGDLKLSTVLEMAVL